MQIILVKLTLYVTEKCQKNQTISILYLLQAQPALVLLSLSPVYAVLQQCADRMATVWTLIRPIPKEQADLSLHCLSR